MHNLLLTKLVNIMLIKDLLNKFDLFLKLSDAVLNIEVDGDFKSYSTERVEDDTFYRFQDDLHELLISETADEAVWYTVSPAPGLPGKGGGYDKDGVLVSVT